MFKEFKKFALKSNAFELAIGVIIGSTFQSTINSLVNDIIKPLISLLIGNSNFANLSFSIKDTTIPYGSFISSLINFFTISFVLFLIIRYSNKFNKTLEKAKIPEIKTIKNFKKNSRIFNYLDKIQKSKEIEDEKNKTTKQCPFCYSEINKKATRCPHCTAEIK